MGAYMFNSEFLYKKSNMLSKASPDEIERAKRHGIDDLDFDPDYFKTDKLAKIYLDMKAYQGAKNQF